MRSVSGAVYLAGFLNIFSRSLITAANLPFVLTKNLTQVIYFPRME